MEDIQDKIKKRYILHFIIKSSLNLDELERNKAFVNEKIQGLGGEVETSICQDTPKKLAYKIDKESHGYFCESAFRMDTEKVGSITDNLKQNNDILRYLIEAKISKKSLQKKVRSRVAEPKNPTVSMQETSKESHEDKEKVISIDEIDKKLDEIIKNI